MLALDECQSERSCPSRSVAPLLKASTRANNNNRGGIPKTHPGIPALQQLNTLLKNKHGKAGRLAAPARSCDCPLRTDVDTSKLWFHTIPPHQKTGQAEALNTEKKGGGGVKHESIFASSCTIINQLGAANEMLSACPAALQSPALLSLLLHLTSSLSLNLLLLDLIPGNK